MDPLEEMERNVSTYEKCGEVLTVRKAEKRCYALKCLYCEKSFMAFFIFIDHIEEFHILALKQESKQTDEADVNNRLEEDINNIVLNKSQIASDQINSYTADEDVTFPEDSFVKIEIDEQDCCNPESLNDPLEDGNTAQQILKDSHNPYYLEEQEPKLIASIKAERMDDDNSRELQNSWDSNFNENLNGVDEDEVSETEYIVKIEDENDLSDYSSLEELKQAFVKNRVPDGKSDDETMDNEAKTTKTCAASSIDSRIESDRDFTKTLISAYKRFPVLWSVNYSSFKKRKVRYKTFKKIADLLAIEYGTLYEVFDIERSLRKLRDNYLADLSKLESAALKGETYTPRWYFDAFDVIRNKLRLVTQNEEVYACLGSHSLLWLNNEQSVQLLQIYKNFPCLWNTEDPNFYSMHIRRIATTKMLSIVEEKMNVKLTIEKLKNRLYRLRLTCTKEKIESLKCERLKVEHRPKCKFYSHLSFLYDHVSPFKCPHCVKTFQTVEKRRRHIELHIGTKLKCSLCDAEFGFVQNLSNHMKQFHQ